MAKNRIGSQLSNLKTYQMYLRQMLTLAENVFQFENLPDIIDVAYLNKTLLNKGWIAFYYEETLDEVVALPFFNVGKLDIYGRPTTIRCYAKNGYQSKTLTPDDYVIMYDSNGRYPLYMDICQLAERMALDTRTSDINIAQQKTNRFFKTTNENALTVKNIINNIDAFDNEVLTYKNINLDDITTCLNPAPYVADKIDIHKEKIFAEFLRLIGISSVTTQKKERLIKDEVMASQGGTIASRYSRSQPRIKAVNEINAKFNLNIAVSYYDGIPTSLEDLSDLIGGDNDDISNM